MKPIAPIDTGSSSEALRRTLAEVERDEAEAISLLVRLLDNVRETSNTAPLELISKVVVQWQNEPPGVIVTELRKISNELGCRTSDNR